MLILGLILIIGATALTVGAVYDGGESASVELLGATVNTTVAGVFFTGAAMMLLFLIGVWLLTASMGRARRKRVERKETKRRHRDSVTRLEDERTQLRAENERLQERLGPDNATGGTATDVGRTTTGQTTTGQTTTGQTTTGPTTAGPTSSGPTSTGPAGAGPSDGASRTDTATDHGAHARPTTDLRQPETSSTTHAREGQV